MNPAVSTDVGPQLGVLLGPLRRAVLRRTRAVEGLPDLPEAQIELLRLLVATAEGISPRQTAERLKMAPSTVSNLIRSMVAAGLVDRRTSSTDLRAVVLTASPHARTLLHRYDQASATLLRTAVSRLAEPDQRALEQALPALTGLLDALTE